MSFPLTGGAGTTQFTTGGLALMALAGLMYKILRRKGGGGSLICARETKYLKSERKRKEV